MTGYDLFSLLDDGAWCACTDESDSSSLVRTVTPIEEAGALLAVGGVYGVHCVWTVESTW